MKPKVILVIIPIIVIALGVFLVKKFTSAPQTAVTPTPAPQVQVEQLSESDQPTAQLEFTKDGHYVTIELSNLKAAQLEYNLIYDATVKKNRIQTGVSGSARLDGKTTYSQKQLLGSESSGKFTYHESIDNAVLELVLRNDDGYSIFSTSYSFEVSPGETIDLKAAE
ncbi:MAG: hypothetical protein A2184_01160 [Candidatus Moranbacteria bacterium RIFOXYA1_FULL_44_7]|uniref:Uncharacterized protein n=1 Tax=Candidatus Amesbacteria bacterium RIFOXYB1_FULL_44_23 TaxID=1797263 RepID=A0A1F4ZTI2_9BACT|nr:MAG: hypothetical protein A2397_00850 [Candidatus Amesbacteria bacterium RIFOXYB1_FULL_44_23]OGI27701.1 MAG: hypothetical protein A2184_01160 [Candidatus Moranbacteria bacterium RIFOXYA1_FULL_44_7]